MMVRGSRKGCSVKSGRDGRYWTRSSNTGWLSTLSGRKLQIVSYCSSIWVTCTSGRRIAESGISEERKMMLLLEFMEGGEEL